MHRIADAHADAYAPHVRSASYAYVPHEWNKRYTYDLIDEATRPKSYASHSGCTR